MAMITLKNILRITAFSISIFFSTSMFAQVETGKDEKDETNVVIKESADAQRRLRKTLERKSYRGSGYLGLTAGFVVKHMPYIAIEEEKVDSYFSNSYKQYVEDKQAFLFPLSCHFGVNAGYRSKYAGGYVFAHGGVGTNIFGGFASVAILNYHYGGRLFAGARNIKIFGEYGKGGRFLLSINTDLESETTIHFSNVKLGLKISWNSRSGSFNKNNIYLGIIEERIETSDDDFYIQNLKEPYKPLIFKDGKSPTVQSNSGVFVNPPESPPVVLGYMLEWDRYKGHKISIIVYPHYPYTGYIADTDLLGKRKRVESRSFSTTLKEGKGSPFIVVKYATFLGWFFEKKKKDGTG